MVTAPDLSAVTAEVTPTVNDYHHLQFWSFFHSWVGIGLTVIAGFNLAMGLLAWLQLPGVSVWGILFVPAILGLLLLSMYMGIRRSFATTAMLREPRTYTVDAAGMAVQGGSFAIRTPWRDLYKTAETGKAFLLFISPQQAHIIPKRSLAQADAARLRDVLRTYAPRKRR